MTQEDKFLHDLYREPPARSVDELWSRLSTADQKEHDHASVRPTVRPVRLLVAGLAAAMLLVYLITPLRVAAQDLIRLFVQTAQDTFSIGIDFADPMRPTLQFEGIETPSDVDLNVSENSGSAAPRADHVYTSLAEAAMVSPFPLASPSSASDSLSFEAALIRSGSPVTTLIYQDQNGEPLILHQTRSEEGVPRPYFASSLHLDESLRDQYDIDMDSIYAFGQIGPASILPVPIGESAGEYVKGAWQVEPDADALDDVEPGEERALTMIWDPGAPGQMLRWRVGDYLFELVSYSESLTREELVDIAAGVSTEP